MNTVELHPSDPHQDIDPEAAWLRVLPEIEALPAEKVSQVHLEITSATTTAIGARPKYIALRGEIREQAPKVDVTVLDRIVDYAYALLYAQSVYQVATRPPDDLLPSIERATELRELLHSDATALGRRGLIHRDVLKDYKGLVGYKNVASDLQLLVTALNGAWDRIQGRCAAGKPELEEAALLVGRIVRLVGEREQSPAGALDAADKRARAFTLFLHCYGEIRRAVSFVRWYHGDADEIAPSLYAGRRRGNAKAATTPAEPTPDQPDVPTTPAPTPVHQNLNSPSPFMPSGSTGTPRPLSSLPGGNPFID